jgi:lipopolysaccharide export system protein LptC
LTHFPYNNSSKFISPHYILHSEKGEPWFIQSERGESEQGTTKITLIDRVILHQNASETEKEKTITTSEMSYFPEKNWAETNKMVFFEEPGLRIQSEGMTANLKEQKINLSQHVTSEYIPNESQ